MRSRDWFFIIFLFLILTSTTFTQPFFIDELSARTRGGRVLNYSRPSSPDDAWWYNDVINCIHDVGCVDIVFCIDTSGSMAGSVRALQDEIVRFAYDIAAVGFDYAFGYMVYCETLNFPHGYDLITDLATFRSVLNTARTGEGGAEAHSDALYQSILRFRWRPGCEHVVVLITDECDDASIVTPATTIAAIRSWGGYVYMLTGDCGDVARFRSYCDTSYGMWFDYATSTLSDVFDQIVDDIADIVEIRITVTNTSGGTINPLTATLIPDFCIAMGDSPNPQSYGPLTNGSSHTYAWEISEIPGCAGWGDCFMIRLQGGGYVDSVVGCFWVEDCGCPGTEVRILCPEYSGRWTACRNQYIELEYTGYLGVNPNSICIRVDGTNYCYPHPRLTWTPIPRGGILRFTPAPPGWTHLQNVNFTATSSMDVNNCPQRFSPSSDFKVDIRPPRVGWWEHFPATIWPPRPARREWRDSAVNWRWPCGDTLADTAHIILNALLYDDGVGMTPIDLILRSLTTMPGADLFTGLWTSLTSIQVTINGVPFIPGLPIPGALRRNVDFNLTYLLSGGQFGGWAVSCTIRADSAYILGLMNPTMTICLKARDLVAAEGCMPCTNDTMWCCTYYIRRSLLLRADAGPDRYICLNDTGVVIGGSPAAIGGVPPYTYTWSPATGLSNPNIANPTANPTVTTTYVLTVRDAMSVIARDTVIVYVSNPVANAGRDTTLCPGMYIQLGGSPTASGGISPYTYSWSPTTSLSSSTVPNPMFISNMGWGDTTITYILTITDSIGCVDRDTVVINIRRIRANAGPDKKICLGSNVALGGSPTASGGIGPYTYNWYAYPPGGSSFSNLANPVVTPTDTTMYVVNILGGFPYCNAVDTCWVYPVQPTANAGRDTAVCTGFNVTLGGTPAGFGSIPPYTYSWSSVPSGFSSTSANPSATVSTTTTFILTVTDSVGCTDADSVIVTALPAPTATIIIPNPCGLISSCEYQQIIWRIYSTAGDIRDTSIRVRINGIVYTLPSPGFTIVHHGTDSVTVTYTPSTPWAHGSTVTFELLNASSVSGCSTFVAPCNFIVDIEPPVPTAFVPPSGSHLYLAPDSIGVFLSDVPAGINPISFDFISVTINGVPATGFSYTWSGGYLAITGLSLSGGDSVVVCLDSLFDAPTYSYCAPNDTSLCWWFTIEPCDLSVIAHPDTAICGSRSVPLYVDIHGGSGFLTYSWSPSAGLSSTTIPNPIASIESTIVYTVTVYDESLRCSAVDRVNIFVSRPVANAGPDGIICPFSTINLGCVPPATGGIEPYSYEWRNGSGSLISTYPHPSHLFGSSGETFILRVVDSLGCDDYDTVIFNMTYIPPTGINLIFPAMGETVAVGSTRFSWAPVPGSLSLLYDVVLDGATVFSRIDSTHVSLPFPCGETHNWEIIGFSECRQTYIVCGETTVTTHYDTVHSANWIFHTVRCDEPFAIEVHVPASDWTACNPDSIIAYIIDSDGIVESSISMTVNGVRYRVSDPELFWDGDSTLIFIPSPMWLDGETISVCVDSAMNIDSMFLVAPVCWEFYIDRMPPAITSISPTPGSSISSSATSFRICLRDNGSGLDSAYFDVEGTIYSFGSFGCVDTIVCINVPLPSPMSLGDTIDISMTRATDCPDWCGPNVSNNSWRYYISPCDLSISYDFGDTIICHPASMPVIFTANATTTGGTPPFTYLNSPAGALISGHIEDAIYSLTGSTLLSVIVTDINGCADTALVRVFISDLKADAGPDLEICEGDTVRIGCSLPWYYGVHYGAVSGWWTYLDGAFLSDLRNPLVSPSTTTSYVLHVRDSLGCEDTDTMRVIRTHRAPGPYAGRYPAPGETVPFGDITIIWSSAGGVPPAVYDLVIDGTDTVARWISDTFFTVDYPCGETHSWMVYAYNWCSSQSVLFCDSLSPDSAIFGPPRVFNGIYTGPYDPIFHTSPCGVPSARYLHVPTGNWTACNPDSIVWRIIDTVGIIPTTIVVRVNGTRYTTASPELTWIPATMRLRFVPSPMWLSGATVTACLDSVMNLDSMWLPSPVCGTFRVDRDPPIIWSIDPFPGSTVISATLTDISFYLTDRLSGLDVPAVRIWVNGTMFTLTSPAVSWIGDSSLILDVSSLGIDCDESVTVRLYAEDSPDWCGPNILDSSWVFYTSPCGLTATIIEPLPNSISACDDQRIVMRLSIADSACPVDPATIVLNVEGVDYTVSSSELDWSAPLLTWTPTTMWTHGTTVDVCLTNVRDICSGTCSGLPMCWSFRIDLRPPAVSSWIPICGSAVEPGTGIDLAIGLADGPANIDTVWVSFNGTNYNLGSALTITGSNANFTWNPVTDAGIMLIPGSSFTFCVFAGDTNIRYCSTHDTVYCCEYFVTADTGDVIAEIVDPQPNTITSCDDQRIRMTIMGSVEDSSGLICGIVPSSIVFRVEGVDYRVLNPELNWMPDTLTFTPSVLWTHGQVVDVCLMQAIDSCGGTLPSPICWSFVVDLEPPALTRLIPVCGTNIIPGLNSRWTITLEDLPAGVYPESTSVILDGIEYPVSFGGDSITFRFDADSLGITLTPGDTITLCISTMDGPFDYCNPNDTIYCCDYAVSDTGGPIGTIVRVPENLISACDPESIIISIVSRYPVVENTIRLRVDGIVYTTASPNVDWLDPYLTYEPIPDWNNHDTVRASLLSATDIFGNPLRNAPLSWTFYIDRIAPTSQMLLPSIEYTRDIRQQVIIAVDDRLAGVDSDSLILIVNGRTFTRGDFDWIPNANGLGGRISWTPLEHGIEFNAGDTVHIEVRAIDMPDLCGPNRHSAQYSFIVEPYTPCLVNPNPFTPDGDAVNEITAFDWPNMTTEPAEIYIYDLHNVLIRKYSLPPQRNYADYIARAWDGKDENGKLVKQGLYLYVVVSDNRVVCNGTVTLLR